MKRKTIVISLLLLSLSLVSCGGIFKMTKDNQKPNITETSNNTNKDNIKEETPNKEENKQENADKKPIPEENKNDDQTKPNTDQNSEKPKPNPILKDAITVYNESVSRMQRCVYEVKGFGVSTNDKSSEPLYIYETLQHSKDELYFEKISNGQPVNAVVTKIGVSFAEKAYISGDVGHRQSASNKNPWTPFSSSNPKEAYPNINNYGAVANKTPDEIKAEFGKHGDNYLNFNIDYDTIKEGGLKYKKNKQGYYLLEFDLVIDNGIESKSVQGYKDQVSTMSGKTLDSVQSIKISIILDKYLRVYRYRSIEDYTVTTLNTKVHNDLVYDFRYDKDLVINKF